MEVGLKISGLYKWVRTCDGYYYGSSPGRKSLYPAWRAGRGQLSCRTSTGLFGEAREDVLFKGFVGDHRSILLEPFASVVQSCAASRLTYENLKLSKQEFRE